MLKQPILHVYREHFQGMLQKHWNLNIQLQKNFVYLNELFSFTNKHILKRSNAKYTINSTEN